MNTGSETDPHVVDNGHPTTTKTFSNSVETKLRCEIVLKLTYAAQLQSFVAHFRNHEGSSLLKVYISEFLTTSIERSKRTL